MVKNGIILLQKVCRHSFCFHSYSTEKNLKKHERVCNDHDYCYVEMPNENNKILKYNHGEKSLKASFMIYAE